MRTAKLEQSFGVGTLRFELGDAFAELEHQLALGRVADQALQPRYRDQPDARGHGCYLMDRSGVVEHRVTGGGLERNRGALTGDLQLAPFVFGGVRKKNGDA